MIPVPLSRFIPRGMTRDEAIVALCSKADTHLSKWLADAIGIQYAMDPAKAANSLLDEIGTLLSAGIQNADTDAGKRKKIASAVKGHKSRGVWADDLKPRIDAITGRSDSQIIRVVGTDEWVLMSENYPGGFYWASLGMDGLDYNLGPYPLSDAGSSEFAGNILIDLNVNQPAEIIQQIRDLVADYLPAYFVVYLGYTDAGSHTFAVCTNGVI